MNADDDQSSGIADGNSWLVLGYAHAWTAFRLKLDLAEQPVMSKPLLAEIDVALSEAIESPDERAAMTLERKLMRYRETGRLTLDQALKIMEYLYAAVKNRGHRI